MLGVTALVITFEGDLVVGSGKGNVSVLKEVDKKEKKRKAGQKILKSFLLQNLKTVSSKHKTT